MGPLFGATLAAAKLSPPLALSCNAMASTEERKQKFRLRGYKSLRQLFMAYYHWLDMADKIQPYIYQELLTGLRKNGVELYQLEPWLRGLRLVFKPPGWHSVGAGRNSGPSIESFLLQNQAWEPLPTEGGLVQRLDYLTGGLLLQAANNEAYSHLKQLQQQRRIRKYYVAWSSRRASECELPQCREYRSYFRSYGPNGAEVRVIPQDLAAEPKWGRKKTVLCTTRIEEAHSAAEGTYFAVSLQKGFRHQLRAQLGFLGFAIAGDPIYQRAYPTHSIADFQLAGDDKEKPRPLGLLACGLELQMRGVCLHFGLEA